MQCSARHVPSSKAAGEALTLASQPVDLLLDLRLLLRVCELAREGAQAGNLSVQRLQLLIHLAHDLRRLRLLMRIRLLRLL